MSALLPIRLAAATAVILHATAGVARSQAEGALAGPFSRPQPVRFAVIGDFGVNTPAEAAVAALVQSLAPPFLVTVGDNNYPDGAAATIDANIGQYYHAWIGNYAGTYGPGAAANAFFPSLGNHDWVTPGAAAYLAYFTLPGNERYYDFVRGPVHFYSIDSDPAEPDGITSTSVQATWLRLALAVAHEPFQVVYFHHPPYSAGTHGDTPVMQWPFRAWGADLVITGHEHNYQRSVRDGFPYIVDGLGGAGITALPTLPPGNGARYDEDHGALFVTATDELMKLSFVSQDGFVADVFTLPRDLPPAQTVTLLPAGAAWRYRDTGVAPPAAWIQASFADSSWSLGPAQLGYGEGDEATVVSFGTDSSNKHVTTWFRRTFTVADPTALTSLALDLLCDDGAIVYLDGVEVVRSNMPAGAVTPTTFATENVGGADENAFQSWGLPVERLVPGQNVLAVEVHQATSSSSDLGFDLRLSATLIGTRLVAAGSTWKYRDSAVAPPPAWKDPTFDDATWLSGPAQLGYGDGDEATVLSYGPLPNQKPITTWFRRSFSLSHPLQQRVALLRLLRDDGAAVYINGSEVFRQNLPRGTLAPSMTSEYAISGADESTFVETWVDARLLHAGVNVIAVELHQSSPTSSDISFDLELIEL